MELPYGPCGETALSTTVFNVKNELSILIFEPASMRSPYSVQPWLRWWQGEQIHFTIYVSNLHVNFMLIRGG